MIFEKFSVVKEVGNDQYFNLYEVAGVLGDTVAWFISENASALEKWFEEPLDIGCVPEGVVNLFLMQSETIEAKKYQMWVYKEVLPFIFAGDNHAIYK